MTGISLLAHAVASLFSITVFWDNRHEGRGYLSVLMMEGFLWPPQKGVVNVLSLVLLELYRVLEIKLITVTIHDVYLPICLSI